MVGIVAYQINISPYQIGFPPEKSPYQIGFPPERVPAPAGVGSNARSGGAGGSNACAIERMRERAPTMGDIAQDIWGLRLQGACSLT